MTLDCPASTAPNSPISAALDRSMLPVSITANCPSESRPTTATCRETLVKFCQVRKAGAEIDRKASHPRKTSGRISFDTRRPKSLRGWSSSTGGGLLGKMRASLSIGYPRRRRVCRAPAPEPRPMNPSPPRTARTAGNSGTSDTVGPVQLHGSIVNDSAQFSASNSPIDTAPPSRPAVRLPKERRRTGSAPSRRPSDRPGRSLPPGAGP